MSGSSDIGMPSFPSYQHLCSSDGISPASKDVEAEEARRTDQNNGVGLKIVFSMDVIFEIQLGRLRVGSDVRVRTCVRHKPSSLHSISCFIMGKISWCLSKGCSKRPPTHAASVGTGVYLLHTRRPTKARTK